MLRLKFIWFFFSFFNLTWAYVMRVLFRFHVFLIWFTNCLHVLVTDWLWLWNPGAFSKPAICVTLPCDRAPRYPDDWWDPMISGYSCCCLSGYPTFYSQRICDFVSGDGHGSQWWVFRMLCRGWGCIRQPKPRRNQLSWQQQGRHLLFRGPGIKGNIWK